jgi:protein-L-isoaspartate O-methyltransferase
MMSQLSRRVIAAAVAAYDFSAVSRVLDVGGGLGHFVAAVLSAHPELHGAVFDVPEVVDKARNYLRWTDVAIAATRSAEASLSRFPPGLICSC